MGDLLGNAVRFGVADDVMAAGEGIETMLSLRCVLPHMPMVGRALGRTSRRHPVPGDAAPALHRPRRRSGRRRRARQPDRAGATRPGSRRSCCRRRSGTSTRISARFGIDALRAAVRAAARPAGRRPFHGPGGIAGTGQARGSGSPSPHRTRLLPLRRRGPRPGLLRGRSAGKRPGPAMAAPGYFPARACEPPFHREAK